MITKHYPSKRPTKHHYPPTVMSPQTDDLAAKLGITTEEYRRRVALVAREWARCPYKKGDTVVPTRPVDKERHGDLVVVDVVRSYALYGQVEWNDPPFIVMLQKVGDTKEIVNCTVGWAQKKEEVVNEC